MKNRSSSSYEQISPPTGRPDAVANFEEKSHLSPLDYVKNRIVEVMRISEEEDDASDAKAAKEAAAAANAAPSASPQLQQHQRSDEPPPAAYSPYQQQPPMEAAGGPQPPQAKAAEAQYEPLSEPDD